MMNILITGGASGIGLALTEYYAKTACVTVLDKTKVDIATVESHCIDLLNIDQLHQFNYYAKRFDALINCAGMREIISPDQLSESLWRDVLELNVTVPFLLSQRQIQLSLAHQEKLAIVNMASISGLQAEPDRCAYVSSKFALIGLTKQLAFQFGKEGIRANAICPGVIETPMTATYFQDEIMSEKIKANTPVGHWGNVDHLIPLVDQCINNAYLNGSTLVCDGGWTAGKSL